MLSSLSSGLQKTISTQQLYATQQNESFCVTSLRRWLCDFFFCVAHHTYKRKDKKIMASLNRYLSLTYDASEGVLRLIVIFQSCARVEQKGQKERSNVSSHTQRERRDVCCCVSVLKFKNLPSLPSFNN